MDVHSPYSAHYDWNFSDYHDDVLGYAPAILPAVRDWDSRVSVERELDQIDEPTVWRRYDLSRPVRSESRALGSD